jgi:hypothetical protein
LKSAVGRFRLKIAGTTVIPEELAKKQKGSVIYYG